MDCQFYDYSHDAGFQKVDSIKLLKVALFTDKIIHKNWIGKTLVINFFCKA